MKMCGGKKQNYKMGQEAKQEANKQREIEMETQ